MQQIVINGDNLEVLKKYPDNYFDAVVTDPPYGLGKEPDAVELMKGWVDHGYHEIKGAGFMGKEWDAFVPQPLFWKEVFRVLKHGGHVVSFFGTRTYDWGVMAMRFAGFEVRDCIQWLYGCLSDDTEILTKSGYIQYHKFIKLPNFEQQEILIYDAENDIYKWEKPERWNEYNINKDTCYRIKSDSTDQIVSRNHRCLVEREGKLVFIQAEYLSEMERMPTLSDNFLVLQDTKILQSYMQRTPSRSRMEKTRTQGEESVVGRNERELPLISNGRKKSILERGNNLSKKEGILFGSQVEVCEMSKGVYSNGEKGWVCGRIPLDYGEAFGETTIENGMCASYRPQSNEQRHKQSNVICNEQGTQAIRTWRSYSTTLATITPIEYSGVIFCPSVSTGAFVARRKGKIFLTGNSGFPKSHNIGKNIEKINVGGIKNLKQVGTKKGIKVETGTQGFAYNKEYVAGKSMGGKQISGDVPIYEINNEFKGWGSALKPANEPIVLARKPLEKGLSIAENVLKWGTGGINIDGCRVGFNEYDKGEYITKRVGYKDGFEHKQLNGKDDTSVYKLDYNEGKETKIFDNKGRFPANIILTHHPECECKGLKKVKGGNDPRKSDGSKSGHNFHGFQDKKLHDDRECKHDGFADENGEETIEDWECHPDCPIKIMDEQSGILKSGAMDSITKGGKFNVYGQMTERRVINPPSEGGASRFFYCAKASKSERNKGLENFDEKQTVGGGGGIGNYLEDVNSASGKYGSEKAPSKNFHPTVKPVKLMQYLARLITPPNGKVLDPFCGSGTTGIACKLEGFEFVGIEQDPEYTKIAQARITNWTEEKETSKQKNKESDKTESAITQTKLF